MNWLDSPTFKKVKNYEDTHNTMEINEYYNVNQNLKESFQTSSQFVEINGFQCQNENCKNKEAVFGTTYLPYCDKNIECLKKNVEYLILENAKLKK